MPMLCTREDVKAAMDSKSTAYNNDRVDRAIKAATDSIEGLCHRRFYPEIGTRSFAWPNAQNAGPGRLWLDENELVSVTSVVAGGITIPSTDYYLEPNEAGPPYNLLEINRATSSAFSAGATSQRSIIITGLWAGCPVDEEPAGALGEALDTSETAVDVTDSTVIGVGQILRVDSERMIVTGKRMIATGQTVLTTALTNLDNNVSVLVTDGTAFAYDETILVDSERMRIVDIAGNTLTVKRAYDGSVLAAHSVGAAIYAPRTLVVQRGALGTTAAEHLTAAPVVKFLPPALVSDLAVAEAENTLHQQAAGYVRLAGSGDATREAFARGLQDLRDQVYIRFGRKVRIGVV